MLCPSMLNHVTFKLPYLFDCFHSIFYLMKTSLRWPGGNIAVILIPELLKQCLRLVGVRESHLWVIAWSNTYFKDSGVYLDERNNLNTHTYHFVLYWLNFSTCRPNKIIIKHQILHVMLYLLRYDVNFLTSVSTDAWWW